jgi:hypothetical protein
VIEVPSKSGPTSIEFKMKTERILVLECTSTGAIRHTKLLKQEELLLKLPEAMRRQKTLRPECTFDVEIEHSQPRQ